MPSGSNANTTGTLFQIEWKYWGDMQFLIPHIRHKSKRTSNFSNKPLLVSLETNGSLTSSADTENVLLNKETCKDTIAYNIIKSLPLQDTNSVLPGNSDDSSHFTILPASSFEQNISASINTTKSKKHVSSMKFKRKVPAPDAFYMKRKKKLESYTACMSETSQYMKETLNVLTQSLKEPSENDDLQYFVRLLPIFKKLNDIKRLNV